MLSLTCDNFRVFGGGLENYAIHIYGVEQQIPLSPFPLPSKLFC